MTVTTKQDFVERMKAWDVPQIALCLKMQAHDLRLTSSPDVKNIYPIDVDILADFFESIGERLLAICGVTNERSMT